MDIRSKLTQRMSVKQKLKLEHSGFKPKIRTDISDLLRFAYNLEKARLKGFEML